MDTEEVFACSLRDSSFCDTIDYTIVKPPLLSHTPDFSFDEEEHYGLPQLDQTQTPLLYAVEPVPAFLDEDMFSLDQDQNQSQGHGQDQDRIDQQNKDLFTFPVWTKSRNGGNDAHSSVLIQNSSKTDSSFSTVPQDNYRIWLQSF